VGSRGLRQWLSKKFYDAFGKVPGSQALQDAQNVISGKAVHEGEERQVAVRIAEHEGCVYLDLADPSWRVVRIGPAGWKMKAECPVKFIRRRGMLALPEPVSGGKLEELRPLVNLPEDRQWHLAVAWLVATIRHGLPFPILVVNGEQGSAKSTLCRMLRALVDPNKSPLRRPPRDDRDLMIAANNGWVVAYDNLSGLPDHLSDALCSLATGGGFGTRQLYTDDEEKLFDATRPTMLNGIEDVASRPDLIDRAVSLTLSEITDGRRRDEKELWQQFEKIRPRVLGALLDAVSCALKNLPHTRLDSKPRMADFALWVTAAEPALGWKPGAFLQAYNENRAQGTLLSLESSHIAPLLLALVNEANPRWEGTLKELLAVLDGKAREDNRKLREWPRTSRALSGHLRRLAPNLRKVGLTMAFGKHTKAGTPVALEWVCKTPSPPSPPSPVPTDKDLWNSGGDGGDGGDGVGKEPSPRSSPPNPLGRKDSDGGDGGDGVLQPCSEIPPDGDQDDDSGACSRTPARLTSATGTKAAG
jgi:hypothetical protein